MPVFDIADSLGSQANEDIAAYLTDINDLASAHDFIGANVAGQGGLFPTRAWKQVGSKFGFIQQTPLPANGLFTIQSASAIQADTALIGQSIKITLDSFYVHNYPGHGAHKVLFDFAGKSQIEQELEDVRHPLNISANDQAHANVGGAAIFVGLNVDQNGLAFEGRTINVESDYDQQIINTFESNLFKAGLKLINSAKPVLKPYTALTVAAIKAIAGRSGNKQVHNFNLGLDFSNNATSNKLRLGSYLVIQTDDLINVNDFHWNQATASLQYVNGPNTPIDFNYMVIGVSSFQAPAQATP